MAKGKLRACVLCVSSFGDSQSLKRWYHHYIPIFPALPSTQEWQAVIRTVQKNDRVAETPLMYSCFVRGADQCKDRLLSAPLFGQDVPLCATEHIVEKQGDVPVTGIPLSYTLKNTRTSNDRSAKVQSRAGGAIGNFDVCLSRRVPVV